MGERLYRLRNDSQQTVRVSWGESIAAASVGERVYAISHLAKHWREVCELRLRVSNAEPPFHDARHTLRAHLEEVGLLLKDMTLAVEPSEKYLVLRSRRRKASTVYPYIQDRLYAVEDKKMDPCDLKRVTLAVTLTSYNIPIIDPKCGNLSWALPENVDERVFEGIVRLTARTMAGLGQRVLLIGDLDSIETIGACAVMEFLGCAPENALTIIRTARPTALSKSELLESVLRYRIS